jgi:hypothetical protein
MVVCMSRRIAVDLYNALIALRTDWASARVNREPRLSRQAGRPGGGHGRISRLLPWGDHR